MNEALRKHLACEYLGPRWLRIEHVQLDESIAIDDPDRFGERAYYCRLTVTVSDSTDGAFRLKLANAPLSHEIKELIEDQGGSVKWKDRKDRGQACVSLSITKIMYLRRLARQFRRAVDQVADYRDPDWKWVCSRTAESIDELATSLMSFRRNRRASESRSRTTLSAQSANQFRIQHNLLDRRDQKSAKLLGAFLACP